MSPGASDLCYSDLKTGMANAVFTEIAERLEALAARGESSAIDLRSLPLTEADLMELRDLLGEGEVRAELEVVGRTSVRETSYPGAWWIRHYGAGGKVATEEIAITPIPEILASQAEDIAAAVERIHLDLAEASRDENAKEASNG
ncbi:MAG: hydrogenase expression/formation protein [Xanthomonadales bacterium]|nr:hydrogenase expression/formation protein [Xanthomonadales bacterium]NIX13067.1 hydrogenase expression/formation protein [Xanthomonadales bacterium]